MARPRLGRFDFAVARVFAFELFESSPQCRDLGFQLRDPLDQLLSCGDVAAAASAAAKARPISSPRRHCTCGGGFGGGFGGGRGGGFRR